jgi:hypothetical protein
MWSYCIGTFDKSALRPTVHLYIPYGFYSKRYYFHTQYSSLTAAMNKQNSYVK